MKKQKIIHIININKSEMIERFGVQKVGLFGSCVRGQENESSDIDILVSFNRDVDLFEFIDLREYLESKLKARIDLVMEAALKPSIGNRIRSEVEYV
jgi:uncharacterized protein